MKRFALKFLGLIVSAALFSSSSAQAQRPSSKPTQKAGATKRAAKHEYPGMGVIERNDPEMDKLIAPDAKIELLASGFQWAEGPVWMRAGYLVFSDVPRNVVFKWQEGTSTTDFLFPSGYTQEAIRGGEPGSNGLTLDKDGRLVLCQHGDRQVARLGADRKFHVLAQYYNFRRFNSPNDLVFASNGDLYFTDPPYGLEGLNNDPKKELMFNGVYRLKPGGEVELLIRDLTFPNGITLSPDEKTLLVAISDSNRPVIMAYDIQADGAVVNGRVLFDTTPLMAGRKGVPDGLKVDRAGNVFATGPGGVLVITPDGRHLGTINTGEPTANCGWGNDGSVLYITANDKLCRVKTLTKGKLP